MSNFLQSHGLHHARISCFSLSPGVYSKSCLLNTWFHQTIFCHPLPLPPSIFPSIRVFSNELTLCIRWPKYWSSSINHSSEYSELISFRIDCFDLLAVQGTLKSLLQHHSLKASVLQCSAFLPPWSLKSLSKMVYLHPSCCLRHCKTHDFCYFITGYYVIFWLINRALQTHWE